MLYYTILSTLALGGEATHNAAYYTTPGHTTPRHPPHHTAPHCTSLHCTALFCTTMYCTAPHCTTLHHTTLHYPTQQYTALSGKVTCGSVETITILIVCDTTTIPRTIRQGDVRLCGDGFRQGVRSRVRQSDLSRPPAQERGLLYCTVLYCTVMYCTVLYCTISPDLQHKGEAR